MSKVGQPSKYKEAYINEVVEYLAKGHSIAAFAGHIGIAESTIHEWVKRHEEFAHAVSLGKSKAVAFWEARLIEVATSGTAKGNITAIIFGLKNRAGAHWRDVQSLEHTGKDGAPIKTEDISARDKLFDLVSRIAERERENESNKGTTH